MPKYDERLYSMVKALTPIQTLCSTRVYHIEIIQAATDAPLSKYPAVVYYVSSDRPEVELAGRTGWRVASFVIMCFARKTEDIRTMAAAIDGLAADTTIADANDFGWITVDDISDEYEIPFEYDEKAMKSAVLAVTILYPEDT